MQDTTCRTSSPWPPLRQAPPLHTMASYRNSPHAAAHTPRAPVAPHSSALFTALPWSLWNASLTLAARFTLLMVAL